MIIKDFLVFKLFIMFDFEQLNVYQKALGLTKIIFKFLEVNKNIDYFLQDQLKRAVTSIVLNIAEGVGRFTVPDRRRFYIISRGSAFEVIAIMQIIANQYVISSLDYENIRNSTEEISKMLFGLINKTTLKNPLETRTRT